MASTPVPAHLNFITGNKNKLAEVRAHSSAVPPPASFSYSACAEQEPCTEPTLFSACVQNAWTPCDQDIVYKLEILQAALLQPLRLGEPAVSRHIPGLLSLHCLVSN
jgi:hypothetical protein